MVHLMVNEGKEREVKNRVREIVPQIRFDCSQSLPRIQERFILNIILVILTFD